MARKKTEDTPKETDESVVVSAAKAIGTAAGKVAALAAAVTGDEPAKPKTPPKPKTPKLAKKNKSRLPRREKKALKRAKV